MSEDTELLFEVDGHVAVITLNRPHKLNAVTPDMARAIEAAIGFSPMTWHPAFSAVQVTAQWWSGGVRSTTKSGFTRLSVAFRSEEISGDSPNFPACACARA